MSTIKMRLEDQLTKENNKLNAYGDELILAKEIIKTRNIVGLQPVIDAMYEEFEAISDGIGTVSLILGRARSKEVLRSCVHIVNQQSCRVAAFKGKLDNLIAIVNR